MRKILLPAVITVGSLTSLFAQDSICAVPNNVKPDATPIPLCLVAKKVAATLDAYNSDPNTTKNTLPKLQKAEFEFKTVTSNII